MPISSAATLANIVDTKKSWNLGDRRYMYETALAVTKTYSGKSYMYLSLIADRLVTRSSYPELFSKLERDNIITANTNDYTFVAEASGYGETPQYQRTVRRLALGSMYVRVI